MKFKIVVVAVFCFFSISALAQKTFIVKGLVVDTATSSKIDNATITILSIKDSVLQKFAYTNKGNFEISNLNPGKFLLMVTYPDYADFVSPFALDADKPLHNFGNIKMILKSRLLDEVIIKSRVASMKIKGDTTEFNAAAYATQKNAKVEDLLKQLQGVRINQNGEILFQGEAVSKMLVDGEEFFSDDPALVAKTIRADMVNKIQVYDQKSDKAKLTGIDDGVKVKTINIVLQEDKRKGVFGKVDAGYGTDDFYAVQTMFNKFSPKQKISAFGNIGNTGKVGLSGADNNKFGSGFSQGNYGGIGIPFARDGGAHYDNKWNKDKQSVNINYTTGALTTDGITNNITQDNLPGSFNVSNRDRKFHNYSYNQSFNASFTSKLDSTSDLRISGFGYMGKSKPESITTATTVRGNGMLQNSSTIATIGDNDNQNIYSSANYTKRFKKKGRNLSVNASSSFGDAKTKNYLKSELNFYDGDVLPDRVDNVDQYKPGSNTTNVATAGVTYSDILSKSLSFTAGYSFSRTLNKNSQLSFNQSSSNSYSQLDSAFSSDFRLVNRSGTYYITMAYTSTKASANISNSLADAEFKQTDRFSDVVLNRKFLNWTPSAYFRYQLNKATSLTLTYSGSTEQPGAYQLQQLRQNSDPLNITLGNPDLRPSFRSNLYYFYRVYQPTLDRGLNFRGNYAMTSNAIVSDRFTDAEGINTFQYSNLKGRNNKNWDVYAEVYGHATKLDFILYISTTVSGSTNYNYVNGQLNKVIYVNYAPQVMIGKNKAEYSYGMSLGPNYLVNSSSLQSVNNNSKGFFTTMNYFVKLPYNFFMGSDLNYKFTAKNQVFDQNFEQLILNSYVGKSFLKNESLKMTIKGNDLLNQNTGYSRNGSTDRFTETRNVTIKRYFMVSMIWDFAKYGKSLQKQQ
ncbi:TonB-dependent receptor [Pedobacter frigoris]|uniref:TonB-dependent receptor n=1 Tax=Pedobacter frigoris TaxID=2571272 RepID=UPI00292D48CF|nr:TonB-dependent receptor [Pedobacter frigoris]